MSGSFTTVGTVLGAAIGSVIPGAGWAIGSEIGGTIGALADAATMKPPHNQGDFRLSTSTYETPITSVLGGTWRTTCPVVWAAQNSDGSYLTPHSAGGKGKQQGGDHSWATFAFIIGHQGITFPNGEQLEIPLVVDRIWMGDKIVWQSPDATKPQTWPSGSPYFYGDYVTGSDGNVYMSVADNNSGHDPVSSGTNFWIKTTTDSNWNIQFHPSSESTFIQAADLTMVGHDGATNTSAMRGYTFGVLVDSDLWDIGNTIPPSISCEVHTANTMYWSDVFTIIFKLCGLGDDDFDVTAADATVCEGFAIEQRQNGQQAIHPGIAFNKWDLAEIDGKVVVVRRGGEAVLTIPDEDLSAASESEDQLPSRNDAEFLADQRELHSQLTVMFRDKTQGFRQAGRTSNRNGLSFNNPTTVDTGLCLSPTEAVQLAGYLHDTEWYEGGGNNHLYLPHSYLHLAPSDVVIANDPQGNPQRYRISNWDGTIGLVKLEVIKDDKELLNRYETDTGSPVVVTNPSTIVPTIFGVASPATDFSDHFATYPGFYVWVNAADAPWSGGTVNFTFDPPGSGRTWVTGPLVRYRSLIGTADGTLATAPATGYYVSPFTVTFSPAYFIRSLNVPYVIAGGSTAEINNGLLWALVGEEIVGIKDPGTMVVPGQQALGSIILRGIRGSITSGHTANEFFAISNKVSEMVKVQVDDQYIGQTVYVQVLSQGQVIDDAPEKSCTIAGPTPPYVTNLPPMDPSSVTAGSKTYTGQAEIVPYTANFSTLPPASQRLLWSYSTNAGSTWSADAIGGFEYTPPSFGSGTMRARAKAETQDGRLGTYVSSTDTTYSTPTATQSAPVDPSSVGISFLPYSGLTEKLLFTPIVPSGTGAQQYEFQSSTDSGSTWSSSVFAQTLTGSFSSGVLRARVRAVTAAGNGSWVSTSDQTYVAPSASVSGIWVPYAVATDGGAHTTYTFPDVPIAGTRTVFINGMAQQVTADYTESGASVTFGVTLDSPDTVSGSYFK
jgi:hypothetical protein